MTMDLSYRCMISIPTVPMTENETDKKIACVELWGGVRNGDRNKFPLGSVHIWSVSILLSISVSGSVNEP